MNAMGRFTLKSLRANRVRTIVTVAGVALAAALLTAVLTSFTTLNNYLYQCEKEAYGNWMASSQLDDGEQLEQQMQDAKQAGEISDFAMLQDVGFGDLSDRGIYDQYLPIINLSGNVDTLCAIRPSQGRLPQNSSEIILFDIWQERDVNIGDTLNMSVGQRMAVLATDEDKAAYEEAHKGESVYYGEVVEENKTTIEDGTILNSATTYQNASQYGGDFNETLIDLQERTFTVVGFYDHFSYTSSTDVGIAGFTTGDTQANGTAFGYITIDGMSNSDQVEERAEEVFSNTQNIRLHTSMLRFMGIRGGGAIWDTFFGIVAVLAIVIIVACVSLIYNAFAISVAERMGQFGLLSSVGASRKQLRRSVILEAFVIASVGILLGLLIGIGGCAVTFAALGPSLATIIGSTTNFTLFVSPWAIVLAAGLTLATVLFSVFIPAWRVGRISTIEALRSTSGNRASKRGIAKSEKHTDPALLWKKHGIVNRIFGISGTLAHINNKRGTSKGTTAAVSLALAIVLLMTAGALSTFLGYLVNAANTSVNYDIGIGAALESQVKDANTLSSQAQIYSDVYDELSKNPNAEPIGWTIDTSIPIIFSEDMAGSAFNSESDSLSLSGGKMADNNYGLMASLMYLDDNSFDEFAKKIGANPDEFRDPEHPRAIALKSTYGNNGNIYQLQELFKQPGEVQVITGGEYNGSPVNDFGIDYSSSGEGKPSTFSFTAYREYNDEQEAKNATSADTYVPIEDVQLQTEPLEIAYLVDEMPDIVGISGGSRIVVPMSLTNTNSFGTLHCVFNAGFNAIDGNHEELAEALTNTAKKQFNALPDDELIWFSINDYLAEQNTTAMLATVINVFCLLFTIILTLIAMANMFNTITNSLILRRREFAVMRSIGLSDRQFHTMILNECINFGIKGLIPGMLISAVVSYLLFYMVTQSMSGLVFNLPWTYAAIAIVMTAVAMGISAAFGMHRCKANNVVEALRMDNI